MKWVIALATPLSSAVECAGERLSSCICHMWLRWPRGCAVCRDVEAAKQGALRVLCVLVSLGRRGLPGRVRHKRGA